MKTHWKKGFFSSTFELFAHTQQIGELNSGFLTDTAKLNGLEFEFRKKSLFESETIITDLTENKKAGRISFNFWRRKATITINEETFDFKYNNFFGTKWSVSKDYKELFRYEQKHLSGYIDSEIENGLLSLSGLYASNHLSGRSGSGAGFFLLLILLI